MSKSIHLTIPERCHEDWDKMTPVEKGRFCDSCQKQVVDFTKMSDRQVAEFFKQPSTGSLCGRFLVDQLDRDLIIPKKRTPWVRYFFQFAIPAFLLSLKSSQAKAQGSPIRRDRDKPQKSTPKLIDQPRKADSSDRVKLGELRCMSKVQAVPFVPTFVMIDSTSIPSMSIRQPETQVFRRTFTISSGYVIDVRKSSPSKSKKRKDTPVSSVASTNPPVVEFKIFPNPVVQGGTLSIEGDNKSKGFNEAQWLNISGELLSKQTLENTTRKQQAQIKVPAVKAGTYVLVLINTKTGEKSAKEVVIN